MTTPVIITLAQAQAHLKLPPAPDGSPSIADADLQLKVDAATELVCQRIADRHPADLDWIAEIEGWSLNASPVGTPPLQIVAAVLMQTGELFRFRGDEEDTMARGYLSPRVENMLLKFINHAFA